MRQGRCWDSEERRTLEQPTTKFTLAILVGRQLKQVNKFRLWWLNLSPPPQKKVCNGFSRVEKWLSKLIFAPKSCLPNHQRWHAKMEARSEYAHVACTFFLHAWAPACMLMSVLVNQNFCAGAQAGSLLRVCCLVGCWLLVYVHTDLFSSAKAASLCRSTTSYSIIGAFIYPK